MPTHREVNEGSQSRRVKKYLRVVGISVLVIIIVPGLLAPALYVWDSNVNRGFTRGYYGEFNRTSNALSAMPTVRITNSWYNNDISLEEFQFDLVVNGQSIKLFFKEEDPVRDLSGPELSEALEAKIREELAGSSEN